MESWFHLGLMHLKGWGTRANPQQALYFWALAAKMGHALAQYDLAMLHLQTAGGAEGCAEYLHHPCRCALRKPHCRRESSTLLFWVDA